MADGGQRYGGSAFRDALATARADAVPIISPRAGAVWSSDDGVTLRFIGPEVPFLAHTGNDINDNSIAFILEYRSFRMLFTGDAGAAAERRFLATGIDLHADVLRYTGYCDYPLDLSISVIGGVQILTPIAQVGWGAP